MDKPTPQEYIDTLVYGTGDWNRQYEHLAVLESGANLKLKRHNMTGSFGLVNKKHISQYSVVGEPADFYIYLSEVPQGTQPWSNRIHDANLYHTLKAALEGPQAAFIELCTSLFEKHKKAF